MDLALSYLALAFAVSRVSPITAVYSLRQAWYVHNSLIGSAIHLGSGAKRVLASLPLGEASLLFVQSPDFLCRRDYLCKACNAVSSDNRPSLPCFPRSMHDEPETFRFVVLRRTSLGVCCRVEIGLSKGRTSVYVDHRLPWFNSYCCPTAAMLLPGRDRVSAPRRRRDWVIYRMSDK